MQHRQRDELLLESSTLPRLTCSGGWHPLVSARGVEKTGTSHTEPSVDPLRERDDAPSFVDPLGASSIDNDPLRSASSTSVEFKRTQAQEPDQKVLGI